VLTRKFFNLILSLLVVNSMLLGAGSQARAQTVPPSNGNGLSQPSSSSLSNQGQASMAPNDEIGTNNGMGQMRTTTQAMRIAAAANQKQQQKAVTSKFAGIDPATASMSPLGTVADGASLLSGTGAAAVMDPPNSAPDYFGIANWANSPLPVINATTGVVSGGMKKFIDTLPGLCGVTTANGSGTNDLGQCIPIANPDTTTFPGSDYYEISLVQFREQLHFNLPAVVGNKIDPLATGGTELRGYVQTNNGTDPVTGLNTVAPAPVHYLGPMILARRDRPVRVKFTNSLPIDTLANPHGGDLFLPLDSTYMGAGMGPNQSISAINVVASGVGYTSAPTVVLSAPPVGGTQAAATASINNGRVISLTVTDGGAGYTSAPTVTLNGGGFTTRATATAVLTSPDAAEMYKENRATLHLHGGNTPWISDGTPHQWTTPQGEITSYSKGASVAYVPDMWFAANGNLIPSCAGALTCATAGATNDPGPGALSFYWTNQQSGRLLFYHDHAYGITRLNVYAGEAAGYLITDPAEESALAAAGLPGTIITDANGKITSADLAHLIPLIVQDKTFVPDNGVTGGQLAATDPTWDVANYGGLGNLWLPHIWMPNQNPADVTGSNAYGRWDYGPWFWPPQDPSNFVAGGQPYACNSSFYSLANPPAYPPLMCPGIPHPSGAMEAMMDTPVINGTAYPTLTVDPTAYRFQMLMAGNDRAWNLGLYVADPLSVAVTLGGSGYTSAPSVSISGGGGSGAAATAVMSSGAVTSVVITGVGHGYTSTPSVTINGDGTGAAATAVVDPITSTVTAINVTNIGTGYSFASVAIAAPASCTTGCLTASAIAYIAPAGSILGVNVTNPGSGFTSAPTVTFTNAPGDTTGSGGAAIASINSEVKMVDAAPHTAASALKPCSKANDVSGANLVLGLLDANGNPLNGTGLPSNCYPSAWPTDGRDGGVPDPLTAGPAFIQIGTESGLLPHPVVIPSTPVSYEYNRKSITVLNIYNHGLTLGPAERADVVVDFSQFAGKTIILYNDAPAPVPAFDPRNDYYTGGPDNTASGGAPTTLPGYGPNTRTLMQIKVNAAVGAGAGLSSVSVTNGGAGYVNPSVTIATPPVGGTPATAVASGTVSGLVLTAAGSGYTAPTVSFTGGGGTGASATMSSGVVSSMTITNSGGGYITAPAVSFSSGGGSLAAAKSTGSVDAIAVTNGGAAYASMPTVSFTGGSGSGALATATGTVDAINVTNGGSGYVTMPVVTVAGATATATGGVDAISVGTAGAGYTAPSVTMLGGATATATGVVDAVKLTAGGSGYVLPTVVFTGGTPTTPASATANVLDGVITAVTVTFGGTTYTAPTVAFTDVTGSGALATAVVSGGVITGINVTAGGSGYTAPSVAITDSTGSGATFSVTLSNGVISGITLTSGGVGYTSAPTVSFTGGGSLATAAATMSVTAINVTAPGSGYASAPTVNVTDTGTPTTAVAATATLLVNAITVTAGGSGYATAPAVTLTGAATATATLKVSAITVTNGGSGYTSAPAVSFSGGAAAANATLKVTGLLLTSPGSGYTSAPTVTLAAPPCTLGPGCVQASATAAISSTGIHLISGGTGYTSAPTVNINDTTGTGATALATLSINNVTLTNAGAGYTSIPAITFSDTGTPPGTGAVANANLVAGASLNLTGLKTALPGIFTAVQNPMIVPEPATNPGAVPTYSRIQDRSLTGWFGVPIASLALTNPGAGYSAAPNVAISAPPAGGIQATASVTFTGAIVTNPLILVSGGAGYSSAPLVTIAPPGCTPGPACTTATATALFSGGVGSVSVSTGGSNYQRMPLVSFTGGGGSGAVATASGAVNSISVSNGGNGYNIAPTVTLSAPPLGGTQATATVIITARRVTGFTITNAGSGYINTPTVTFNNTGTGGSGASATTRLRVNAVIVTLAGTNYTTPPTVTFNNGGTGGSGAAATAVLSGSVTSLLLTSSGSGYTSAPTVGFTGGGTPTTPANATANFTPGVITGITLTNPGSGYTSLPIVTIVAPGCTPGPTCVTAIAAVTPPATEFKSKAIQELFTLDYGRMNATFGVEVPFTNFFTQTTIPYGYIDPPTELYKDGEIQIWKITHNGVDTHFIHFHLFDVQVINRVGWDGMIKPPDDNEIGWKDTVRMNPLEDIIIALKPMKQILPWGLPNNVRPLDVTMPIGASNANNTPGFANIDIANNPAVVTNDLTNFGWEYTWHCHILAHEEIDMMRPAALAVPPAAPTSVTAVRSGSGNSQRVLVSWIDSSVNESGFSVQRATSLNGPWLTLTPTAPAIKGTGTAMSFTDTTMARRTSYYYRVVANNLVGYARAYAAPAVGYPTLSADSAPVNAALPITTLNLVPGLPIFADSFETGLVQWSGQVGNLDAVKEAVIGPNGGDYNLAATIDGGNPAYLYDLTPNGETMYDANFYFNPNNASSGDSPVDIFLGLDQNGQPAFGVQYQSLGVNSFQLRAWVMQNGAPVYTGWDVFTTDEPEDLINATHKIEVAYLSDARGGLSLYIDDAEFATLRGDTSATQMNEALLGPSLGVSATSTGTMYFDEFTSSRINGLPTLILFYLPLIVN
jgi:FtsP/CotA-like multicopper oxidase with cupredoxin domain